LIGINLNDNLLFGESPKLFLTHPLILELGMGMDRHWHQSIQNPSLLLCPTLGVEHLNLAKTHRVSIMYPKSPSLEKTPCSLCTTTTLRRDPARSMDFIPLEHRQLSALFLKVVP
jgi:hypothetical protein